MKVYMSRLRFHLLKKGIDVTTAITTHKAFKDDVEICESKKPLSEDERRLVYDEAYRMARRYSRAIRGQTITEQNNIEYWIILATEKAHGIE